MPYANVVKNNGFIPLDEASGSAHKESRPVPAVRTVNTGGNISTDLALGDAYALDVNGNAYRAGPGDIVRGIVCGFDLKANPTVMNGNGPLSVDYITGTVIAPNTFPNIIGLEDNKALLEVQADTFAIANNLGNFNLADRAPDAVFRISTQSLNVGGGAGSQFKLIRLKTSPFDNSAGAGARVVVQMLQSTP